MKEYIIKTTGFEIDYKGESLFKYCEELIRCRDCIYLEHWKYRDGSERLVCCTVDVYNVSEDDFCSWGERKENGR